MDGIDTIGAALVETCNALDNGDGSAAGMLGIICGAANISMGVGASDGGVADVMPDSINMDGVEHLGEGFVAIDDLEARSLLAAVDMVPQVEPVDGMEVDGADDQELVAAVVLSSGS